TFSSVKAGTFIPGNGGPDGMHYDVRGNLWAALFGLGGIVQINPRGIIVGFVPIPNDDTATTNFAFGGPDNQYIYLMGAISGTFWRFKAPYPGLIGPGGGAPAGAAIGVCRAGSGYSGGRPSRADERKVRQVVLNLLSNAIKFTGEGGPDRGSRSGQLPRDRSVEVSVSDTGVGIAPEDQEAVFEEFRQVGTAEKKVEGTGLGLTLCRKFVELHRGADLGEE